MDTFREIDRDAEMHASRYMREVPEPDTMKPENMEEKDLFLTTWVTK